VGPRGRGRVHRTLRDLRDTTLAADQRQQACECCFDAWRAAWLVDLGHDGASQQLAGLAERGDLTERQGLHDEVAEGRRLGRARDDGAPGDVGRELVEQAILAPAADDVER
jgi:hypothetical protein